MYSLSSGRFYKKIWVSSVVFKSVLLLFSAFGSAEEFPPTVVIQKTTTPLVIDGKMDEDAWQRAPELNFFDLTEGSNPPWRCYGKIIWDDKYLYYGIHIEDPDVWAKLEPKSPDPDLYHGHEDEFNMYSNPFAKIFFDPDGDGSDYVEVHINAMNQVDDAHVVESWFIVSDHINPDNWRCAWEIKGLKTAVFVDGTLNNSRDIDKGWSVEAAFPWSSIKEISKGNCPPEPGDSWRAHCGWVYLNTWHGTHMYYTWPVMGVQDCHILPKWGYITFAKEFPVIPWKWYPGMPRK